MDDWSIHNVCSCHVPCREGVHSEPVSSSPSEEADGSVPLDGLNGLWTTLVVRLHILVIPAAGQSNLEWEPLKIPARHRDKRSFLLLTITLVLFPLSRTEVVRIRSLVRHH
jgi:hypothetical protein